MRAKNKKGVYEDKGKVKVQIDVLPVAAAEKNPVGKARKDPNHSPTLPMPEGRITLSLNPWKMWQQMLGPAVRRKICLALCCILCLVLCLSMIPTMGANFVGWVLGSLWERANGGGGDKVVYVDGNGASVQADMFSTDEIGAADVE